MEHALLIEKATEAMNLAYAPYSKFKVGAALQGKSGKIYTGCNVENSSFGATICAERVAFVKAVSEGETAFDAIGIVTSNKDFVYPCGVCRQFMSEFGLQTKIILGNGKETKTQTLNNLLPEAFVSF